MNATPTVPQSPNYDLNMIFRPYMTELQGEYSPGSTGEMRNPLNAIDHGRSATALQSASLFNVDTWRLPCLDPEEPLISWFLRAAGIVSDVVMRDTLEISSEGGISISEILKLSGRLAHSDLRALERAIFYVLNASIYKGFAAISLSYAFTHFVDFDEALWNLGLHPNDPFGDFGLVGLIEDCDILPKDKMMSLRKECLAQGTTIGWGLVKNEMMSGQLVKVLLECLSAVSTNKLDYETLLENVKAAVHDANTTPGAGVKLTPEALLVSRLPISTADRALGNLLLGSAIMELDDLVFCAEVALEDKRSLGVVISDFMIVDPILLEAARTLAYMLGERKLTARRSVELLEEVKSTGRPLSQVFLEGNRGDLTVVPSNGLMAVSIA